MSLRFTTTMPPLSQIFSFRAEAPCLVEDFAESESPRPETCRFRAMCESIAMAVSEPVRLAYDDAVRVTLSEPSGNIVSRSESNWRGDHARLSLRKHFFEYEFPGGFPCRALTTDIVASILLDAQHMELSQQQLTELRRVLNALVTEQASASRFLLWHDVATDLHTRLDQAGLPSGMHFPIVQAVRRHVLTVLGCHSAWNEGTCAKYLGFVDIRLGATKSPIAMGLLVPPRSLRHDPDVFIITGEYGQLFGAPSFPSSVYSKFDPEDSGAACSQSCLIMALGILSDRGVKPLGSYDLTYLGKVLQRMRKEPRSTCLARSSGAVGKFRVRGLTVTEMCRLLNRPDMQTRAHHLYVRDEHTSRRLIARLVEAYLLARYPAILPVEARVWAIQSEQPEIGHCLAVIGMRRSPRAHDMIHGKCVTEVTELIVHDPQTHPFVKRPLKECLDASVAWSNYIARRCENSSRVSGSPVVSEPGGMIELIFVTEERIVRTGADCVNDIRNIDEAAWVKYVKAPEDGGGPGDFRMLLVHRRDIKELFAHAPYDEQSFAERLRIQSEELAPYRERARRIQRGIENLPADWYWSVACYDGGQPVILWLFRATTPVRQWDRRIDL